MKKIEDLFVEILTWIDNNIEGETAFKYKELFNRNFDYIKEDLSNKKIDYCIEKFVNTEMDYITEGKRGIGRFTEDTPRFGGYYKKHLKKLDPEKVEEFRKIISSLIKKAYVTSILITDTNKINIENPENLYKKWIPKIYTFEGMSESIMDLFLGTLTTEINLFKRKLDDYNLKPSLFSEDKHEKILFGYSMCGNTLWLVETLNK